MATKLQYRTDYKRSHSKGMKILLLCIVLLQFLCSIVFFWMSAYPLDEMMVYAHTRESIQKLEQQKDMLQNPYAFATFGVFNLFMLHYVEKCIVTIQTTEPIKQLYVE